MPRGPLRLAGWLPKRPVSMDVGVKNVTKGFSQESVDPCCYSYRSIRVKGNTTASMPAGGAHGSPLGTHWCLSLIHI